MPLTNIKLPKKTNTQTNSYTGASGEVTIDTDKKVIVIHDGSTAGGFPLALQSQANAAYDKANTGSTSAGLKLTANSGVPPSANVGDQWWATNDNILYQYINDGTSNVWVDISSSAITSTTTATSSTNNARTMINAYVFGS